MGSLDLRAGEDVEFPLRAALITLIGLALDDEKKDGCGMIVDLMGQKFEPEPEIITIKGGLERGASGDFAT